MGLLTGIFKTAANVVILPLAAVADAIDILDGGNSPSITAKAATNIKENAKDVLDDLI